MRKKERAQPEEQAALAAGQRRVEQDLYTDEHAELRYLREFRRKVIEDLKRVSAEKLGLPKFTMRGQLRLDRLEAATHQHAAEAFEQWLEADFALQQHWRELARGKKTPLRDSRTKRLLREQAAAAQQCSAVRPQLLGAMSLNILSASALRASDPWGWHGLIA